MTTTLEMFRTPTIPIDSFIGVDRQGEAIRGVALLESGDIREIDDRKYFVDATTMDQFVRLAATDNAGLRARFTHGDLTGESLGSYLGRWKNFRIDGNKVRADLFLSPRSHDSPKGDLGKYTMDMAESDPDMLGASMQAKLDRMAMQKSRRTDGFSPIRIRSLHGADIVDTPALVNSGMFAAGSSEGDDEMSDAITKEQFDAGIKAALESMGKMLAESTQDVLAKVNEKFTAQQSSDDEPTPEQLRAEGAKLASEIMAFAAMSGLNDSEKLAQEAIKGGQSVESFKASLADRLIAQNKMSKGDGGEDSDDPHAAFKAEFNAGRSEFDRFGVDLEGYIRTRCRDEGLPVPPIKKAG